MVAKRWRPRYVRPRGAGAPPGAKQGRAIFVDSDIELIRDLHEIGYGIEIVRRLMSRRLRHPVSRGAMRAIIANRTWRHVRPAQINIHTDI